MKNIISIFTFFLIIINIVEAKKDLNVLQNIANSADVFFPIGKFINENDNLDDNREYESIPYYMDRFKIWENVRMVTSGTIKFKIGNVEAISHDVIQIDKKTRKPISSFCMFGDRDAAIYIYLILKIGQNVYLCHQWYNEIWKPAHNEWGISSVIIRHDISQDKAIMFFWDKKNRPYILPCGVASALYEKIGQKITLTFFDRRGRLTELDNEGYRISRIEAPHDDDDITCYLNDKKIDIQCFKIGNWREMMIYNLWNYGNSIDWKN